MAKPVLLIGLNEAHLGISSSTVLADHESPVAIKTSLGWVAYDPTKFVSTTGLRILHVRECQQLHQLVSNYFETDNLRISPVTEKLESDAEKQANAILKSTMRQLGNRYEVGLLWKTFPPQLPRSREMAVKRLISVESRMSRDEEFALRYKREIAKYVEKGYARKVTDEELNASHPQIWYLPHFAVFNPNKPSKLRIVFDAAASVNGVLLNSALLKGPEEAQPLLRILLQFRQGKIGVAADIREMFSQIKVRPIDQHAQRYLWRNGDPNEPIQELLMTTMIFGAVCSPCIAERVKNKNAERFETEFPKAASTIINNHYVDDLVASFDVAHEAITVCQQIVNINLEAGFELRDFISNCSNVERALNKTPPTMREIINMERSETAEKVLGMYWNTKEDVFEFHTKFHRVPQSVLSSERAPTKRELLSIVMAVFDPFGLLANLLISSKIMVQETWRQGINWDEALSADLTAKWIPWWKEFQRIRNFQIPRCYSANISCSSNIELHIFVDASQVAFAAVGYFRVVHNGVVDVTFVMAKTRTAPNRLMSIPRLELQAAVLGTRLSKMLVSYHDFNISRILFWSDSQTVLQWIYSSERKYKAFVGHRIAEIISVTVPEQWRWVPTNSNPADAATRPSNPPRFNTDDRWINGPEFLKYNELHWPATIVERPAVMLEEVQPSRLLYCQASKNFIDFTKFRSYLKIKRIVAWVLRAKLLFNRKSVNMRLSNVLTAAEIEEAEIMICKTVQQECFASEISDLSSSRQLSRQSAVYSLTPYLDEKGLLRLNGRIDMAMYLPFETRHPILFPAKHIVAELIVKHHHEKGHHQNLAVIINTVRQKFWIPHIKTLYKRVQRNCLECRLSKAKPVAPMMGQLPADRVTPYVRPFS
ncbi:uncharacterized protein LOC118734157 [Rhagoletis pomonella]|uniref:uncharacterized protein LOC118734157 n=1 Tax=Rhagoletis pomonella TaxID=28610 RepID=UPI00177F1A38|nr:uncharacterized protein LOC118734157 [Rhagoletis pomonella]